jgi:hypothetical protein
MRLPREEQIVRAVCSDKFDRSSGRVSPSLFKGPNTSVSRLTIIPLPLQWRKLAATVQKLPGRRLERLGEIGVGPLEDLGLNYVANDKPMPITLSVVADAQPTNEAHALIPENITTGLGSAIVRTLNYHDLPADFRPELVERLG